MSVESEDTKSEEAFLINYLMTHFYLAHIGVSNVGLASSS